MEVSGSLTATRCSPHLMLGNHPETHQCWDPVQVERPRQGLPSSSLLRQPGRAQDFVRGTLSQHPFLPGGFPGEEGGPSPDAAEWLEEVLSDTPLLTIPPGFIRGGKFGKWVRGEGTLRLPGQTHDS